MGWAMVEDCPGCQVERDYRVGEEAMRGVWVEWAIEEG